MEHQNNLFGTYLFKKALMHGVSQAEQTGDFAKRMKEKRRAIDRRVIDDGLVAAMMDSADEYSKIYIKKSCVCGMLLIHSRIHAMRLYNGIQNMALPKQKGDFCLGHN